jgi:fatty acid-binding protein DegV
VSVRWALWIFQKVTFLEVRGRVPRWKSEPVVTTMDIPNVRLKEGGCGQIMKRKRKRQAVVDRRMKLFADATQKRADLGGTGGHTNLGPAATDSKDDEELRDEISNTDLI